MSSLFSPNWYRVSATVPRLRTQAKIFRHVYRGEVWHLLQDLGSGKFIRLNAIAYRVVSLMDGHRTLEEVWNRANAVLADQAPSQDELIQLLAKLHQANLLASNRMPDLEELEDRRDRTRKSRLKQYFANPLALRFPLVDPDRFLDRCMWLFPHGLRPLLLLVWLTVVGSGGVLTVMHWQALTSDILRLVFTTEYILMLLLVFPVLKALHELGHGIAIKLFGGQCHEMGVMLLVLLPIPYVDATHASGFRSKYGRMLVGAAGMMIELFLASIALWLWLSVEPGLVKVFLHEVIIVAGISTLLFNLNPLLRLDGYYILADWLEIPNLGQKSNQYLGFQLKKRLLRVKRNLTPPHVAPGEPTWLIGYAILSFVYRMLIVTVILAFVATQFFVIGVLLAIWAFFMMIILPFGKTVKAAWTDPALAEHRARLASVSAGVLVALGWLAFVQPLPSASTVEGVVWMGEDSQVRSNTDCFGVEVLSPPGPVRRGQSLLRCDEPLLRQRFEEFHAKRRELLAGLSRAEGLDVVAAMNLNDEIRYLDQAMVDLQARIESFVIRSPHAGEFVSPSLRAFEGRYWQRGELIGHVLDRDRYTIMVAVPQRDADRVRHALESVSVRHVTDLRETLPARVVRDVPAASRDLPSMVLSLGGGGQIGIDPASRGNGRPQSLEPLFLLELDLESPDAYPHALGSRVYVRFQHPDEPLARQLYRVLRDQFLRRFLI
jgi:putative peptide zinc metalloprotease protein